LHEQSPQTQVLLLLLPVHVSLQSAVLHPQSSPSQPASHAHTLQLQLPWPLHVAPFASTGQGKMLTLQNVPAQPVPVGHSHPPHAQVPPLAAHAGSQAVVEQSHVAPDHPASQLHVPQRHVPWPSQARPLPAAGGHGENDWSHSVPP
jgi:hypothetical protein